LREPARLTRDVLVVRIDPSRVTDPELEAENERERLKELAAKFSAEDLMRSFDLLTKAELDIRGSVYPRYHLEMAILRWIPLRKLVPISDLIQGLEPATPRTSSSGAGPARIGQSVPGRSAQPMPTAPVRVAPPPKVPSVTAATVKAIEARDALAEAATSSSNGDPASDVRPVSATDVKDSFLAEIRKSKKYFYGTVVAQAQRIDIEGDRIVFTLPPQHRLLRDQLEQMRTWLDALATQLSGRKMTVAAAEGAATAKATPGSSPASPAGQDRQSDLRQQALADSGVQAMLDVFAAEIKDVEERK